MAKEHHYKATIIWTGNKGVGTKDYNHITEVILFQLKIKRIF